MKIIKYGAQSIKNNDFALIKKALKSSNITQGKYVDIFENKIKNFVESKYCLSCNSGTAAIHLAFTAFNINYSSVIIMPVINFIISFFTFKSH